MGQYELDEVSGACLCKIRQHCYAVAKSKKKNPFSKSLLHIKHILQAFTGINIYNTKLPPSGDIMVKEELNGGFQ